LAAVQGIYNIEARCTSNKHMLDLNGKMEAYFDIDMGHNSSPFEVVASKVLPPFQVIRRFD
jgi:hypothetical protein